MEAVLEPSHPMMGGLPQACADSGSEQRVDASGGRCGQSAYQGPVSLFLLWCLSPSPAISSTYHKFLEDRGMVAFPFLSLSLVSPALGSGTWIAFVECTYK